MHRDSKLRGFTLIELLVVIAVIAGLLGMLVPALSKTGKVSRQAACASNLKQLMTALQGYSSDNLGVIFNFEPTKTYVDYLQKRLSQDSLLFCPEVDRPSKDKIIKENREGQIYSDPKSVIVPGNARQPWKRQRGAGGGVYYGTYGFNGFFYNRANTHRGGSKLAFSASAPLVKIYPKPWYSGLTVDHGSRVFVELVLPQIVLDVVPRASSWMDLCL